MTFTAKAATLKTLERKLVSAPRVEILGTLNVSADDVCIVWLVSLLIPTLIIGLTTTTVLLA